MPGRLRFPRSADSWREQANSPPIRAEDVRLGSRTSWRFLDTYLRRPHLTISLRVANQPDGTLIRHLPQGRFWPIMVDRPAGRRTRSEQIDCHRVVGTASSNFDGVRSDRLNDELREGSSVNPLI